MDEAIRQYGRASFTRDKTAECFYKHADRYYGTHEFGSTAKSVIDLMMFGFYDDACSDGGEGRSGLSSFTVARELGITAGRVEGYRERRAMQQPRGDSNEWARIFLQDVTINRMNVSAEDIRVALSSKYNRIIVQDKLISAGFFADGSFGTTPSAYQRTSLLAASSSQITQ